MFTSRRKITVAWIALLAVLYTAASPALAALRFQAQPNVLTGICTLDGIKAAPLQPADPVNNTAPHERHCIFCISGAWQVPVEGSPSVVAPASINSVIAELRDDIRPHHSAALQPVSPRAPPRLF